MKGAMLELSVTIVMAPSASNTKMNGSSHTFFRALAYNHNSAKRDLMGPYLLGRDCMSLRRFSEPPQSTDPPSHIDDIAPRPTEFVTCAGQLPWRLIHDQGNWDASCPRTTFSCPAH